MTSPAALYLDLLKKSLLEELYWENEVRLQYLRSCLNGTEVFRQSTFLDVRRHLPEFCQEYLRLNEFGMAYGRPLENLGFQHTMLSRRRLENVQLCVEKVLAEGIPGDFIECGVWRGGTTVLMRGMLAAHQVTDRTVWVADSFEGLPRPGCPEDEGLDLSKDRYPVLAIDLDTVRELFERYGLLGEQVRFLPGWFKDTLHAAPIRKLALLRLDGDLYESTANSLDALYHRVVPGGFVIVDDYGCIPQCRQAVTDFRARHNIEDPIEEVDWTAVFWRRSG
jgi:Macrocin-O-methyltransferase (TylF)